MHIKITCVFCKEDQDLHGLSKIKLYIMGLFPTRCLGCKKLQPMPRMKPHFKKEIATGSSFHKK